MNQHIDDDLWAGGQPRRFVIGTALSLLVLATAACGFHLRATGRYEMSPAFSTLHVMVENGQLQNDPLLVAMKNALLTQTDVQIDDTAKVPTLLLFGERTDNQVLSVDSTGKVNEYLLKYEVSFRLINKGGKPLAEAQTVRLQRDYSFDPLNVLAKEREEQELRRELQQEAVQQILRRLASITPGDGHDGQP